MIIVLSEVCPNCSWRGGKENVREGFLEEMVFDLHSELTVKYKKHIPEREDYLKGTQRDGKACHIRGWQIA